jgi:hypothetical protein
MGKANSWLFAWLFFCAVAGWIAHVSVRMLLVRIEAREKHEEEIRQASSREEGSGHGR